METRRVGTAADWLTVDIAAQSQGPGLPGGVAGRGLGGCSRAGEPRTRGNFEVEGQTHACPETFKFPDCGHGQMFSR